jgi:hypothetical protein
MRIQRNYGVKLFAVAALAATVAAPATQVASGIIRHNNKTMKLQGAVAVWNAAENQLRVALLPFVPTAAEITEIRRSGALFVAAERPRSDPSLWERAPFAVLIVEFEPGTTTVSLQRISHYRLEVSWLDRMRHETILRRSTTC